MKVLLIDDHPVILSALQAVIAGVGETVEVVGVEHPNELNKALQRHADLDLALLDLAVGGCDGFEVLGQLRRRCPQLPVVVVSNQERIADVVRAVDMGAMGFVPKRASNDDLCQALRLVMFGGVHIPRSMLGLVRQAAREHGVVLPGAQPLPEGVEVAEGEPAAAPASVSALGLTPRQTEVMARLLRGLPNKLIARELSLSVDTVKDHVAAVLRALGVTTRTQAVLVVSQMPAGEQGLPGWSAQRG